MSHSFHLWTELAFIDDDGDYECLLVDEQGDFWLKTIHDLTPAPFGPDLPYPFNRTDGSVIGYIAH